MKEHEESRLMSAYLDGELSDEERARAETHLRACQACRLDMESLRYAKRLLSGAPRRAMPPELIADIADRLGTAGPPPRPKVWGLSPRAWFPAGAFAAAALSAMIWIGLKPGAAEREIPLELLMAAHSRYAAETLVSEENAAAADYSSSLNLHNGDTDELELD